jgi:hypothetical protein
VIVKLSGLISILEKFDQAIVDYKSALDIKTKILPVSNRQIAEVHFRLSLAYDMTSGKLENQIEHVEKALESVKTRLQILKDLLPKAPENKPGVETDAKGKGKATAVQENPLGWTPKIEVLENLTKSEIEAEIKDVTSLSEELEAKVRMITQFWSRKSHSIVPSWKISVLRPQTVLLVQPWIKSVVNSIRSSTEVGLVPLCRLINQ